MIPHLRRPPPKLSANVRTTIMKCVMLLAALRPAPKRRAAGSAQRPLSGWRRRRSEKWEGGSTAAFRLRVKPEEKTIDVRTMR